MRRLHEAESIGTHRLEAQMLTMLLRHLAAILILPFVATVVVPILLLRSSSAGGSPLLRLGGGFLMLLGLLLVVSTIWHFASRGSGTLAPWDPPRRLVVTGIYRHVRNPMISGVFLVLLGESLLFGSAAIALWAAVFILANVVYIPLAEEPALQRRFGAEYQTYRQHVPRWVPRLSPWNPKSVEPGRAPAARFSAAGDAEPGTSSLDLRRL